MMLHLCIFGLALHVGIGGSGACPPKLPCVSKVRWHALAALTIGLPTSRYL